MKVLKYNNKNAIVFQDILDKRRQEGSYKNDKRDFIDMFIQEIDKHLKLNSQPNFYTGFLNRNSYNNGSFVRLIPKLFSADEQFITTTIDLFEAGSETSSNTMEFAIYFAMKHPSVQDKIFEEIERVVGKDRYPTMEDKHL